MKYKTRKLVLNLLAAILASFLLTCIPFGPPDDYDEFTWTNVEYSLDGSSITIYLDGSAPVRQNRALNLKWAQIGHDLFEVAFYHPATNTVARAVWEQGHAAGISGVTRNVNYADAFYSGQTGGNGAAILFVGKKSDRTLLALGKLSHVNGVETTLVDVDAKTVTFSVAALKTGVSNNAASSCFTTDALRSPAPGQTVFDYVDPDNTEVFSVTIGLKPFPLFWLNPTPRYVHGEYQFEVNTGPGDFDSLYRQGILLKTHTQASMVIYQPGPNPPSTAPSQPRIPRYPAGEEHWETSMTGFQDLPVDTSTTAVTAVNNLGSGSAFVNPVQFTIGPTSSSMDGHVFAFSFEIPVIPLIAAGGRADQFSWYLRPGYDSYKYDLDDGDGNGGAILLGTGNFERSFNSDLFVRKQPAKTRYPGTGSPTAADWLFNLTDIEVYLRRGVNTIDVTGAATLYYVVNNRLITTSTNLQAILEASASSGGIVEVRLEYYDPAGLGTGPGEYPFNPDGTRNGLYNGDDPFEGSLLIYYIPIPAGLDFGNIQGSYVITNTEDWWRFQNGPINSGTAGVYIVVFFENINIGSNLNIPAGCSVILLAGRPNIIIGKTPATVFTDQSTAGARNAYYFGVWPFDEILSVNGMGVNSERFILNAGGTYDVVTFDPITGVPSAPDGSGLFLTGGDPYKTVNDAGVTILNRPNFY